MKSGLDAMPLFLLDDLLRGCSEIVLNLLLAPECKYICACNKGPFFIILSLDVDDIYSIFWEFLYHFYQLHNPLVFYRELHCSAAEYIHAGFKR